MKRGIHIDDGEEEEEPWSGDAMAEERECRRRRRKQERERRVGGGIMVFSFAVRMGSCLFGFVEMMLDVMDLESF